MKKKSPLPSFGLFTLILLAGCLIGENEKSAHSERVRLEVLEDSVLTVDLRKAFGSRNGSPRLLVEPGWSFPENILEGRSFTFHPPQDFWGTTGALFYYRLSNEDTLRDDAGNILIDTLLVDYKAVNDPPRRIKVMPDTGVHWLDTMSLDLSKYLRDPEGGIQFKIILDTAALGYSLKNSTLRMYGRLSLNPVQVKVASSDQAGPGDTLSFLLDPNGPLISGKKIRLPMQAIDFSGVAPQVRSISPERMSLIFFGNNPDPTLYVSRVYLIDGAARLRMPLLPGDAILSGGSSRMLLYTFTSGGSKRVGWISESGSVPVVRSFVSDESSYNPIGEGSDGNLYFLREKGGALYLSHSSGEAIVDIAPVAKPSNATLEAATFLGGGFAFVWSTGISPGNSRELSATFLTGTGSPAGTLKFAQYSTGSKANYTENYRMTLGAFLFDGRLEILHTSVNFGTTSGSTIDKKVIRTVIGPDFTLKVVGDTLPGGNGPWYSQAYLKNLQPKGAQGYSVSWAGPDYPGMTGTLTTVDVQASTNSYALVRKYTLDDLTLDYKLSDGNTLRLTAPSGKITLERIPAQ